MSKQTFRSFRNQAGELEIRQATPAADVRPVRMPPPMGPAPLDRLPAGSQVPEWAMLRPPASTDLARRFGDWMLVPRAVLIGLLWVTSSPARAGATVAALVLLYALI